MPLIGQEVRWRRPSQTTAVLVMCIILIVAFSVSLNGFLSFGNLFALARNISILGIVSLGMAVVVIGRGLALTGLGLAAGGALCMAAVKIIAGVSFTNSGMGTNTRLLGDGSMHGAVYVIAAGILMAVAMVATYLPARRAAAVEPMQALRTD